MGVAAYLCLLLSCLPGVRSADELTQTPTAVAKPGGSHKLTCATSGFDRSGYYVHWVKQVPGKGLEWVGAIDYDDDENYAPAFSGRFEISTDSSNVYLQMNRLSLSDTAIYYCAADPGQLGLLEYWGAGTSLTVTSDIKTLPSVHITSSCNTESGQEISILCLVKDYQPQIISQTWSTSSRDITTGITKYPPVLGQNNKYTMSSLLRVPAADWNRNNVYYCKAGYNPDNMVITTFQKPQAPQLIPLVPSPEVLHNQTTAVLGCMISGFSPDNITVSWKKAGVNQAGVVVLPSSPRTNGRFDTVAYLPLRVEEWINKQAYTCEVTHVPSGISNRINMRYQEGGECPGCSKCLPKFFYQSNLNVTFSDGSTQQYHCSAGKCEIK